MSVLADVLANVLADVLAFIIGLYAGVYAIAAAYRLIDLWHRLDQLWLDVAKHYVRAAAIVAVLWWLLPQSMEGAYASGLVAALVLHFVLYYLLQALIFVVTRRRTGR